jgi:hypothetical protein
MMMSIKLAAKVHGFVQEWHYSVRPQLLLNQNMLLKLRTKVESCFSSQNHSLGLQLVDFCLLILTCSKDPML